MDEIQSLLRYVWQTENPLTVRYRVREQLQWNHDRQRHWAR